MTEEDNNQDFDNSDESYCWMPRTDSQDLNPPEWLEDGSTMLRIYEDAKVGHS